MTAARPRALATALVGLAALAAPARAQAAPDGPGLDLFSTVTFESAELAWDVGVSRIDFHGMTAPRLGVGVRYRGGRLAGFQWEVEAAVGRGPILHGRMDDLDPDDRRPLRFLADVTGGGAGEERVGLRLSRAVSLGVDRLDVWAGWTRSSLAPEMQVGSQLSPYGKPLPGLDTRYDSSWSGLRVGLEPVLVFSRSELGLRITHYRSRFDAEADWNLREDLRHPLSFEQAADGSGWRVALEYRHRVGAGTSVSVRVQGTRRVARGGNDTVYFEDGRVVHGRLELVEETSRGLSAALIHHF